MYFTKLDSRDTEPEIHVNRDADVTWLTSSLEGYLRAGDARLGRAFRVTGAKGSGKTIFVRSVLENLRRKHSANTIFLEVDCRRCPGSREVFGSIAHCAVMELKSLQRAGAKIEEPLIEAAQLLNVLTRFTDVELKQVHENLIQYKSAAQLGGKVSLLKTIEANFGISLERTEKQIKQLTGSIRLDEYRVCAALRAFLGDLRERGLSVVLFVDNIDELLHDYGDEEQRAKVKQQAGWVLELSQAPVAMIACMRTYFADIARHIGNKRHLDPVAPNVLSGIVERRMKDEPSDVQEQFEKAEVQGLLNMVTRSAPTPLACIEWFKMLCEEDAFDKQRRKKAIEAFVKAEYAGVPLDVLQRVVWAFPSPHDEIDRAALLSACKESESDLSAVQERQVVLPNDFWNPTRFALDPSLHILHKTAHF